MVASKYARILLTGLTMCNMTVKARFTHMNLHGNFTKSRTIWT